MVDFSDALIDVVRISDEEYQNFRFNPHGKEKDQPYVFLYYFKSLQTLGFYKCKLSPGKYLPRLVHLRSLPVGDLVPDVKKTRFLSSRLACIAFQGGIFKIYDWFFLQEYQYKPTNTTQGYEEYLLELEFTKEGMLLINGFANFENHYLPVKMASLPKTPNWSFKLINKERLICLETSMNYLLDIELGSKPSIRGSQVICKDTSRWETRDYKVIMGEKIEIYLVDTLMNIYHAQLSDEEAIEARKIASLTKEIKPEMTSQIKGMFFNWYPGDKETSGRRLAYLTFISNSFLLVDLTEAKVHEVKARSLPSDIQLRAFDWIVIDNYLIYYYREQIIFQSLALDVNWGVETIVHISLGLSGVDFVSLQNYKGILVVFAFESHKVVVKLYPTYKFSIETNQKQKIVKPKKERKGQGESVEKLRFVKSLNFEARELRLDPKNYFDGETRVSNSLVWLKHINSFLLVDLNNISTYPYKAYNLHKGSEETSESDKVLVTSFNNYYLKFNSEDNRLKFEEFKSEPAQGNTQKNETKAAAKKELKGLSQDEKVPQQKSAKKKRGEDEVHCDSNDKRKGGALQGPQIKQSKAEKVRERKDKEKQNDKAFRNNAKNKRKDPY